MLTALEITKRGKMYLTTLELKMIAFFKFLQETRRKTKAEKMVQAMWGYDCILYWDNTNSNGVAVLFKTNFDLRLHSY